jgi:hypothetical protein
VLQCPYGVRRPLSCIDQHAIGLQSVRSRYALAGHAPSAAGETSIATTTYSVTVPVQIAAAHLVVTRAGNALLPSGQGTACSLDILRATFPTHDGVVPPGAAASRHDRPRHPSERDGAKGP